MVVLNDFARAAELLEMSDAPMVSLGQACRDQKLIGAAIPWWQNQLWLMDHFDDPELAIHVWSIGRQCGKALALDTPILTTDGWKTMGTVQPGDSVYGPDGQPTLVLFGSEVFTDHPCYEVEFQDGSVFTADQDHLWRVWDQSAHDPEKWKARTTKHGSKGMWRTLSTKDIASTRFAHRRNDSGRMEYRFRVMADAQVDTPVADLPLDPYVFGYWLGDGHSAGARITVGTEDVAHVRSVLRQDGMVPLTEYQDPRTNAWTVGFKTTTGSAHGKLRDLQVLGDKHIPDSYLTASIEQRKALLAGLLDSDGCITSSSRTPRVEFCVCSKKLAQSVFELVRSLGQRARLHENDAVLDGRVVGKRYRILWTPTFNPFRLERKAAKWREPVSDRQKWMSIVDVRRVDVVPTRCIMVAHPEHVYLAGRTFVPTHNTTCCAALAIHNALLRPDLDEILPRGRTRYIFAAGASQSQAREFVRVVAGMLEQIEAFDGMYTVKADQIDFTLPSGRKVTLLGVATWGRTVRGKSASLIILDEFAHVAQTMGPGSDEQVYAALVASARRFGSLAIVAAVSTPAGRTGKFYDLFEQCSDGIMPRGCAVKATVYEMDPAPDEQFLAQERIALGESLFAQEYLASFEESGGAFFDLSRIQFQDVEAFVEECDMWIGALDPAFHADSFGYALIGRSRAEPTRWLLGPCGGVKPEGDAHGFDARRGREDNTLAEILARVGPYGPVKLITDQHQSTAIESYFGRAGIHVETVNVTGNIQTQAFTSLRARLYDGSLRAWSHPQLTEELRRVRAKDGNKIALPHFGDSHCDIAHALALAVWAGDLNGEAGAYAVNRTGARPLKGAYSQSEFG